MKLNKFSVKKILFYFGLLISSYSNLQAQTHDSLVYFNELSFASPLSSFTFKKFIANNNDNLFDLLLVSIEASNETNIKSASLKLDESLDILSKKSKDETEIQKVKTITKYVQKNYLKTYQLNTNFLDLFESGSYNNLCEMSIYAVIFTKLNIPFQLIERANSISLTVYPATSKIEIKSKETERKYFAFSDHFKKKFALSLYYNHSIAREELEKSSDEVLFDKYYFSNKPFSTQTLASLHFKNKALYLLDDKKMNEGMIEMKKNYLLNPNSGNQFTLKYYLLNSIGSENYAGQNDIDKLITLCRLFNQNDPEITSEFIIAEHIRLIDAYVHMKAESKAYNDYHLQVLNSLNNAVTKNELDFNFNYTIARMFLANQLDHNSAMKYIENAYKIKPQFIDLHSLIIQDFSNVIMKLPDDEAVLSIIEEYEKKFDFVNRTSPIMRVKAHCLLDLAFVNFNKGLMDKGNEYLNASLKTCEPISLIPDEVYVEKAYLEAARNYYIAGNKAKAKEYLNKGLELAPQSIKIKDKLKMVN